MLKFFNKKYLKLAIKKALIVAKESYNIIRYSKYEELLNKLDFDKFKKLLGEVERHIALLNRKEAFETGIDTTQLLNEAMEDVLFAFRKLNESELKLADELKNILRKTREGLAGCFDQKDIEWVNLKEELVRLFKKKNLDEITQDEMKQGYGKVVKSK